MDKEGFLTRTPTPSLPDRAEHTFAQEPRVARWNARISADPACFPAVDVQLEIAEQKVNLVHAPSPLGNAQTEL